jgi:quercetin dioxygenase-like cupin family protein
MNSNRNLSSLFQDFHFKNYPLVAVPQEFQDERGVIKNIADGALGDVAFITSTKGAVRANHIHRLDWHLTFLISGKLIYQWKESSDSHSQESTEISSGQLFYTPANTPHKMTFLEESQFIAVSGLHRDKDSYESDTKRLSGDFFSNVEL